MENLESNQKEVRRSRGPIKVRCPECFKLFGINPDEIHEARPHFACSGCQTKFWVPYPECLEQEAMIGFPVEWIESKVDVAPNHKPTHLPPEPASKTSFPIKQEVPSIGAPFNCPKCSEPYFSGQKECDKCGVIFSRFKASLDEEIISGSKEQHQRWDEVVADYGNEERHQEFLRSCFKHDNLEFATDKYSKMLKINPSDEMAKKLHGEITALSTVQAERVLPADEILDGRRKKLGVRLSNFIIALSTIVIVMGYFVPGLRNLIGLGASCLFFVLALKYYFRIF